MQRTLMILLALLTSISLAYAQEDPDPYEDELEAIDRIEEVPGPELIPGFAMGFDLGYVSLPSADGEIIGWQRLALNPDFSLGPFGIGLAVDLNVRFDGGADGTSFEVRPEDWIPQGNQSFWDVYLAKIRYLRYGEKGDPLFVKFGSVDDAVLGNGFILGSYRNTLFMPELRILGLAADLDGKLFSFPYVGVETFVPNLAQFDVMGGRIYIRPVADVEVAMLKEMQIGITGVIDRNPYAFNPDPDMKDNPSGTSVAAVGVDFKQPIVANDLFSLAVFGDAANQNGNFGTQLGMGGRALVIFDYSLAARFLGDNFIPVYFDQTYDITREQRLAIYNGDVVVPGYSGWFARLGLNVLQDTFTFGVSMDGSFNGTRQPTLRGDLILQEGVIGDLSAQAWYQKNDIDNPEDLASPEDAIIGAKIGYRFGPALVSMLYNIRYDPYLAAQNDPSPWDISSKIETSISLVGGGAQ